MLDTSRTGWFFSADENVCSCTELSFCAIELYYVILAGVSVILSTQCNLCSSSNAVQFDSSLQNDHTVLNRASFSLWSNMLEKPKLTIRSTHCGENVVTRDERSGSESFGMVSRETSGRGGERERERDGSASQTRLCIIQREIVLTAGDLWSVKEMK